jgi:hypothetical protein
MGQYYKLVNQDKKEVVVSWDIGGTAKFFEWLYNNQARVLVWLLRQSNEWGGGDVQQAEQYQTLGRWAGDRITLVGDYDQSKLYQEADGYHNISHELYEEFNTVIEEEGRLDGLGVWRSSPPEKQAKSRKPDTNSDFPQV